MSFYVTLPSDSSMKFFPNNKTSSYITRLPAPIELKGEWEVGLVEFTYPHTWYNVNVNNNFLGFDIGDGIELGLRISPGFYKTIQEILNAIDLDLHKNKISFKYHPITRRVSVRVKKNCRVILHNGLAELLGFEPMQIINDTPNSEKVVEGSFIADPRMHYRILMLYTDIIESQIVGDVLAPLLKIVNVRGSDGEIISKQYERPQYLPVSRKNIDTIEINIRTHMGELTPFERGRSYVKLHFRQKYLS